jgi:translocation and assembly module TamA
VTAGLVRISLGALLAGVAMTPLAAQITPDPTAPGQSAPERQPEPTARENPETQTGDIVSEPELEAALPSLSDDPEAPLEPMDDFETPAAPAPLQPGQQRGDDGAFASPALPEENELGEPLTPLATFDVNPPAEVAEAETRERTEIRYSQTIEGLDALDLRDEFDGLSTLREGRGRAENAAQVAARAREDEQLAIRLMRSIGYYDATAVSTIEQNPANSGNLNVVLTATPGGRYRLGEITVVADETDPPGMVRSELALREGEPIDAARVQGAEANVALKLPQQGYPFVEVGQRDILLDEARLIGDYTLPVTTGPRSSFGAITTEGDAVFDLDHLNIFPRFRAGELYDVRRIDDMRDALIATGLFSTVSVEPQRTGQPGPDGTEQVNLLVRQNEGPARTLSAEGGFAAGQGLRLEGAWTHRNLFPPEGALIVNGIAGTQEQGLGVTFRRSNAGRRDRTVSLRALASRNDYEAFEAFTGTIAGRISYDSTPIWQKRFTYYYGFELVGTNEDRFDFDLGERVRDTYFIGALPLFGGFDMSDDLLNPTRGYRLKLNLSPEVSLQGNASPYVRAMVEATAYFPVSDDLVIAGRARAGSIAGIARDDLAPSRRYYAGGGGSVRGFGFQQLGPRTLEPNPDFDPENPDEEDEFLRRPIGGRSLNEFAIEARYRFGNFGIVPFIDAGQVYDSALPRLSNIRFGAGIGGRFYTNFGPMRVDVATPINRQPGESLINLYISIGQAF